MPHRTDHTVGAMVIAAIAALGLAGCSSEQGGRSDAAPSAPVEATLAPAVRLVDVEEGLALVADPSVVVVDVRTPAEFAEGHLDRAQLVDFSAPGFRERIAQFDRSTTYLVYCRSGNRSGQATAVMAELGFTEVYDLHGGIGAWQGAGAPVVI